MNELGRNQLTQLIVTAMLEACADNNALVTCLLENDNDLKITKKLVKKLQTKTNLTVGDNDVSNKEFKVWREQLLDKWIGKQEIEK